MQNESEEDEILRTNRKKSDLGIIRHHLGTVFLLYEKTLTNHTQNNVDWENRWIINILYPQWCICKIRLPCMPSRFSRVRLFVTLWTIYQAPLSMRFSRQEYWSGLLFPSPGDLPDPEMEPTSPVSPALAGRFFTINITWEDQNKAKKWYHMKQG